MSIKRETTLTFINGEMKRQGRPERMHKQQYGNRYIFSSELFGSISLGKHLSRREVLQEIIDTFFPYGIVIDDSYMKGLEAEKKAREDELKAEWEHYNSPGEIANRKRIDTEREIRHVGDDICRVLIEHQLIDDGSDEFVEAILAQTRNAINRLRIERAFKLQATANQSPNNGG